MPQNGAEKGEKKHAENTQKNIRKTCGRHAEGVEMCGKNAQKRQ